MRWVASMHRVHVLLPILDVLALPHLGGHLTDKAGLLGIRLPRHLRTLNISLLLLLLVFDHGLHVGSSTNRLLAVLRVHFFFAVAQSCLILGYWLVS